MCAPPARPSDPSGAPETDGDLAVLENDRDVAPSGKSDHPVELVLVLFDVDVSDRVFALRVVLTGRGRVGSGVLSEDFDTLLCHRVLPLAR